MMIRIEAVLSRRQYRIRKDVTKSENVRKTPETTPQAITEISHTIKNQFDVIIRAGRGRAGIDVRLAGLPPSAQQEQENYSNTHRKGVVTGWDIATRAGAGLNAHQFQ